MRNKHWPHIYAERLVLTQQLQTPEVRARWDTPSLCPGWTVHDVVAHLVDDASTTWSSFAVGLLRARFDFDRLNQLGLDRRRGSTPEETLQRFVQVADRSTSAPAPAPTRLVELIVHGEDIRRPLGLRHIYPVPQTVIALQHQLRTPVGMGGGRDRADGLTIRATDFSFLHGSGPEVTGSSLALLLAVSGRPVDPGEVTGPGAPQLLHTSRT